MFDYLFGLILLGLGLQSPMTGPSVKGDQTEISTESAKSKLKVKWLTKEMNTASRSGVKEKHEVFRQTLRSEQEKFRLTFEVHKASAEARLQERKEEFEAKLAEFKDETKKQKVEYIQTHFDDLNIKLTDRATETIMKISELLDRVIEKTQDEKINGKDTTKVDSAIVATQMAITEAQSLISSQLSKTYVMSVSAETNVRADALSIKHALASDMKTLHESVVAVRKALNIAIRELAKVRGEPIPDVIIK